MSRICSRWKGKTIILFSRQTGASVDPFRESCRSCKYHCRFRQSDRIFPCRQDVTRSILYTHSLEKVSNAKKYPV